MTMAAEYGERGSAQPSGVDANAVVAYNLGAIRRRRGWTQQEVADRLSSLSGRPLGKVSISAMEHSGEVRRRRFDAHDLYLLSVVFDVPIAYFFLPPPQGAMGGRLAGTDQALHDLYVSFLGRADQLDALDDRLAGVDIGGPDEGGPGSVLGSLFGVSAGGGTWQDQYRAWRDQGLGRLQSTHGDRLGEAAHVLAAFARELQALGPVAYLCRSGADLEDDHGNGGGRGGTSAIKDPRRPT
jgi:transcriptional regulator with XRE-family HTH domain